MHFYFYHPFFAPCQVAILTLYIGYILYHLRTPKKHKASCKKYKALILK